MAYKMRKSCSHSSGILRQTTLYFFFIFFFSGEMEASGVVSRCLSGAGLDAQSSSKLLFPRSCELQLRNGGCWKAKVSCVRSKRVGGGLKSGYSDNGHLQYYVSAKAGLKEKEKEKKGLKKKLKLIKGVSKDLLRFSSMGFVQDGLEGTKISEATEILLAQLKQLKAEEKELKRKRKEAKAAATIVESSSSSSSSESSDSEGGEVIDMASLRSGMVSEAKTMEAPTPEERVKEVVEIRGSSGEISVSVGEKVVEVCTGGKCNKSGAAALMKEFRERLGGGEAAVVGCKCMGKCRQGPNVRVVTHCNGDGDGGIQANPLCLGVGLEDVGVIVSNFFGEGSKQLGVIVA